jgi:hypothetical protein
LKMKLKERENKSLWLYRLSKHCLGKASREIVRNPWLKKMKSD